MSIYTNNATSSREEAAGYTAALLDLVGNRDPLEVLRGTPAAAARLIEGVRPESLAVPEAPGKWSVRHVLAHLADSDVVLGWRLRMIVAHDQPEITGYDQDLWSDRLHYGDADPAASLNAFGALRQWNLRIFENADTTVLKRYGVHAERGKESVEHMIRLYAGHDTLHLKQIERILKTVAPTAAARA